MLTFWNEVRLGEYPDIQTIRKALDTAGVELSSWPKELIDKVPLATERCTVRLAIVRPSQLFPGRHVLLKTILKKVAELGGSNCPAEVGLVFYLQVTIEQRTLLVVAMEPLVTSAGEQVLFSIENNIAGSGGMWLRGLEGNPNKVWNPHNDPHLDYFIVAAINGD